MRVIVKSKLEAAVIIGALLGLPILGWYYLGWVGVLVGFAVGYIVDSLWPRWVTDLSWEEVEKVVQNLHDHGFNHSRLYFRIGRHQVRVYRGEIPGLGLRMCLEIPRKDWPEIVGDENVVKLYPPNRERFDFEVRYNKAYYVTASQDRPVDDILAYLRNFFKLTNTDLRKDVLASYTTAKKNLWFPDRRPWFSTQTGRKRGRESIR